MITLFVIRPKGFNIGNDAINIALRELIQSEFGRVVNLIEIPAVSHYESHAKAGLTTRSIHEINRLGDGVIVGGGNLYENNELSVDLGALKALAPPLMLFSMSRGRIYNRFLKKVQRTDVMPDQALKTLHESADISLSRDSATTDYVRQLGCNKSVYGGCPTIFLNQVSDRLPDLPENEVPGALISIRTPNLMNVPSVVQARVKSHIDGIISTLRDRGHRRIRILCNDSRDVDFASLFQSTREVDFVYTADPYWYLSLLKSAKLVISYRLHATLPCLSFGTPVVNLSYDERAECLIDDLGFGDWNINMATEGDTVLADVNDRLERIEELASLRKDVGNTWEAVRVTQSTAMEGFATLVRDYLG